MRGTTLKIVIVAVVLGGTLGACSKSSTPSTSSTGGVAPATSQPASVNTTKLEQGTNDQLVFTPADFSIKSGSTLTVTNVSASIPHTFTVTGQKIDITNQGGQSQQVKISLPPGTYPYVCTFHVSQGMKGVMTVT